MSAAIDGLLFLGRSHFAVELDPDLALDETSGLDVDRSIVVAMHPRGGDFAAANAEVARIAERSGGRFVPLARLDPWEGESALDELRRAVAQLGARGVFLHPAEEHFRANDPRVAPILELAGELGIPVVIAAGTHLLSEPLQLGAVAAAHPATQFVLTNGAQFNISGLSQFDAELALGNDNVIVQTSAMYREDFLERVVADFGPERLMFASAAPYFDRRYERLRVELAHFSDAERQLILAGNAERVFGLGGAA